jgi:hypothetical protein
MKPLTANTERAEPSEKEKSLLMYIDKYALQQPPKYILESVARLRQHVADETAELRRQLEEQRKALEWIAAKGWQPHATTSENAMLAYDCHCVAAQALNPTLGDPAN